MKQSEFNEKIAIWGEILIRIMGKELVYPEEYVIESADKNMPIGIFGASNFCKRIILMKWRSFELYMDRFCEDQKRKFHQLFPNDVVPSSKKMERTLIIGVLIHEMLHLSQYIPIRYEVMPLFAAEYYVCCQHRYAGNKKRLEKRHQLIEVANQFQTLLMMVKYQKQLREAFDIIPIGVRDEYTRILGEYYFGDDYFNNNASMKKLDEMSDLYSKERLKNIYFKNITMFDPRATGDYVKWKKASKDYVKAYLQANYMEDKFSEERKAKLKGKDSILHYRNYEEFYNIYDIYRKKLLEN